MPNQDPTDETEYHQKMSEDIGTEIKPDAQETLNKPLSKGGIDPEDSKFLQEVIQKIEKGEIDLMTPASLLNQNIYDALSPEQEQKVDLILQKLLFVLRQIKGLWDQDHHKTFQMANMIHDMRLKKEELEKEVGDVLKI